MTQGFIAISVLYSTYILCKMLGDEEGHCNLQYPKSPQCRPRMKVERAKSHERRKAGCKSAIAERLHADVKRLNNNNDIIPASLVSYRSTYLF